MKINWIICAVLCSRWGFSVDEWRSTKRYLEGEFGNNFGPRQALLGLQDFLQNSLGRSLREVSPEQLLDLEHQIQVSCDKGLQWVIVGEPDYPSAFNHLQNPPLVFNYLGEPVWKTLPMISIVGARDPRSWTEQWMDLELQKFLQLRRACIVSGGARGVDQLAHGASLRQALPTTVVVPSGLLELYPANLGHLKTPVLESGGCFLSEFLPFTKMQKHHFHQRNRLISALGIFTLILDAKMRSGTYMTAKHSLEVGRPVLIVPSHPYDVANQGGVFLLSEGGTLIRDAQDLVMIFDAESCVIPQLALPLGIEKMETTYL